MTAGDPGGLIAAGLLSAAGVLDDSLTVADATQRLVELLDDSTLWRRADHGADLATPERASSPAPAAEWSAPEAPVRARLSSTLDTAWSDAVLLATPTDPPPPPGPASSIVRLTVRSLDDADRLAAIGSGGQVRVAPLIAKPALRFSWRWPMRVGVIDGPRAAEWRTLMANSSHFGSLYDVRIVGPADEQDLDILVVDDTVNAGAERESVRPGQAACVIVVGEHRPVIEMLDRAALEVGPAIAAGVAAPDVAWFTSLVHELSHDQPFDVALALVAPEARVAGDPQFVNLTAVGRWAAAVAVEEADRGDGFGVGAHLEAVVAHGDFTFESHAASTINDATRPLVGTPNELVLERRMATAAIEGPDREEPSAPRRLLADITAGGELCKRALAPHTDHQLEVQIAVPESPGEGVPFAEEAVPEGEGVARLTIVVTCPDLGLREQGPIDLPTADRSLPSGVATFAFRTGGEGSALNFEILVLHGKRPIQEARVIASVRANPARRDRIQVLPVPLSAQPEPAPDATRADLSLDARNGQVTNVLTGDGIPVESGAVRDLLDTIEQRASRVLAGDDAIVWRAGQQAPSLLIDLARLGSQLHRKLADVDDATARTVSLLVRYDTAIIPLELAYSGPAPKAKAKLCTHATRPPGAAAGPCSKASSTVVCPYAFWGMHRTIARTIEGRPKRARAPRPLGPLSLRPVLYAAANLADNDLPEGTPKESFPSQLLQQALREAVGVDVARVSSWGKWRTQVRTARPELLVVLAHTEIVDGESTLLIGKTSVLAQPEVTASLVASKGAPGPLVVLLACSSGVAGDAFFGALPASFTDSGAAAVVATLSKLKGPDGARAAAAVVGALRDSGTPEGTTLGSALTAARRSLVKAGLLVGLVLVAHGEIDVKLTKE